MDNINSNDQKRKTRKFKQPNTVYNAIFFHRESDFSRKDMRSIVNIVSKKHIELCGDDSVCEKMQQNENGVEYTVNIYPESMRNDIMNIVKWYFKKKSEKKEATEINLLKSKMRKFPEDSIEYLTALAKLNLMHEDKKNESKASKKIIKKKTNNKKNINANDKEPKKDNQLRRRKREPKIREPKIKTGEPITLDNKIKQDDNKKEENENNNTKTVDWKTGDIIDLTGTSENIKFEQVSESKSGPVSKLSTLLNKFKK